MRRAGHSENVPQRFIQIEALFIRLSHIASLAEAGTSFEVLRHDSPLALSTAPITERIEKMSGCRRNVEIGKLRVLQAEAALLMQRCGSKLQAAHSDATSHARYAVVAWRSALGLASLGSDNTQQR